MTLNKSSRHLRAHVIWAISRCLPGALIWAECALLQAAEVSIDTAAFRFSIAAETGHCEILDKKSQITWVAQDRDSSFGTVTLKNGEKTERMPLGRCEVSATEKTACAATFHPLPERPETFVRVRFQTRADLSEL